MADTFTTNLGLILPDLNDPFNFGSHVIPNFSTIDGLMGAVPCLSTARPAVTFAGQIAYEKDSGRYIQNTGTKASPVWTYMSHGAFSGLAASPPTSGVNNGLLYYATDQNALMVADGGVFRYKTNLTMTSSARPSGSTIEAGATGYETDTKRFLVYNGSSWEQKAFASYVCTSSTRPASPFQGMEIYETDTTLSAVYSGSVWQYAPAQLGTTQVVSGAASVTFSSVPPVKRLLIEWRARLGATGATDLLLQIDADAGSHYLWAELLSRATTAQAGDSGGLTTSLRMGTLSGTTANYYGSGAIWLDGWNSSTNFTGISATGQAWDSTAAYWNQLFGAQYIVAGPHTSVKLFPATGTMSGEFTLYGWM